MRNLTPSTKNKVLGESWRRDVVLCVTYADASRKKVDGTFTGCACTTEEVELYVFVRDTPGGGAR